MKEKWSLYCFWLYSNWHGSRESAGIHIHTQTYGAVKIGDLCNTAESMIIEYARESAIY